MKKKLLIVLAVLFVLGAACLVVLTLTLDRIIKEAINQFGPQITQTEVRVDDVSLSLLGGSGSVSGLYVGNPPGYKAPRAVFLGKAELSVDPTSLLGEAVVIRRILVRQPEFAYETTLFRSNIGDLQKNVEKSTGGGAAQPAPAEPTAPAQSEPAQEPAAEAKPMKFIIEECIIEQGMIELTALGASAKVPLPRIELRDIGKAEGGVTANEAAYEILTVVLKQVGTAAAEGVKQGGGGLKGLFK